MYRKFTPIAAAVALVLGSGAANAVDFSLRGYGTLGVAHSDNEDADFALMPFVQPEGVGRTEQTTASLDSKLGVQLDARFNDRWSAVLQIVSQDTYGNSWNGSSVVDNFTPSLEWANVTYKATDNLTLRAGRVVLPFLMLSDSQRVGYANHWLRPPTEVYGELPFFTSDGGDVSYRSQFGSSINTLRAHYGVQKQIREEAANNVDLWGVNDTIEFGSFLLRAAYINVKFQSTSPDLTSLFQGFQSLASIYGQPDAAGEALRLEYIYDVAKEQEVELVNIGMSYDANSWFVMAEANYVTSDGVQIGGNGGYISGGLRRGSWTPYVTLARAKSKHRDETLVPLAGLAGQLNSPPPPGLPPNAIPGYYAGLGAAVGMGDGINQFVGGVIADNGQTTTAVGVRWDVASNFALKFQYDHIDIDSQSYGRMTNVDFAAFEPGTKVNLFSIALDFVF